jgi:hypothetical protein
MGIRSNHGEIVNQIIVYMVNPHEPKVNGNLHEPIDDSFASKVKLPAPKQIIMLRKGHILQPLLINCGIKFVNPQIVKLVVWFVSVEMMFLRDIRHYIDLILLVPFFSLSLTMYLAAYRL